MRGQSDKKENITIGQRENFNNEKFIQIYNYALSKKKKKKKKNVKKNFKKSYLNQK